MPSVINLLNVGHTELVWYQSQQKQSCGVPFGFFHSPSNCKAWVLRNDFAPTHSTDCYIRALIGKKTLSSVQLVNAFE